MGPKTGPTAQVTLLVSPGLQKLLPAHLEKRLGSWGRGCGKELVVAKVGIRSSNKHPWQKKWYLLLAKW